MRPSFTAPCEVMYPLVCVHDKSLGTLVKFYHATCFTSTAAGGFFTCLMLKAEMQSQEIEPCNFYSSSLIQDEGGHAKCKFDTFLSSHSAGGAKTFVTRLWVCLGRSSCPNHLRDNSTILNQKQKRKKKIGRKTQNMKR